jgi:periplasmic copper chaperone A
MWTLVKAVGVAMGALIACPGIAHDFKLGSLQIAHPWAINTPPGAKVGGVFMEIANLGTTVDKLISAATPIAGSVEIHTHVMDAGVMKMRAIPDISVEPGKRVVLKPGSYHVMLFDLKKTLSAGEKFPLTLIFEKSGKLDVEVMIEDRAKHAAGGDHGGHKH